MQPHVRSRLDHNWVEGGARRGLRRFAIPAVVVGLVFLGTVEAPGAAATTAPAHNSRAVGACNPQVLELPGLNSTSEARVTAVSDTGLVVGTSWNGAGPQTAVVWTDPTHVIDTGVGGLTLVNHAHMSAQAVDVNEAGTVLIDLWTLNRHGALIAEDAVLWSEHDGVTILSTPESRPRARPTAINDNGDVVGSIAGPQGGRPVPVIWRDGKRSRLPTPAHLQAFPADINNAGLVVGSFHDTRANASPAYGPWLWSVGGKGKRLDSPRGTRPASATDVNNKGRILGGQPFGPADGIRTIMWRNPGAHARRLMRLETSDVTDNGYLALSDPGFRDEGARAFVGRTRHGGTHARLPSPPDPGVGWDNIEAVAIARGQSPFAPQGGITVGGYAQAFNVTNRAILWTCAQTLL